MENSQKQGETLPDLPSSTGVEYGFGISAIFVSVTADPNIMQANTLDER